MPRLGAFLLSVVVSAASCAIGESADLTHDSSSRLRLGVRARNPDVLTGTWQSQYPGLNPAVGNGQLGWVVDSDSVYSAGLFCSHKRDLILGGVTRARIATPSVLRTGFVGFTSQTLSLDVRRAVVEEQLTFGEGHVKATRRWFAHRSRPSLMVLELELTSDSSLTTPFTVALQPNSSSPSNQLTLASVPSIVANTSAISGQVAHPEKLAQPINISVVVADVPQSLTAPAGGGTVSIVLLAAIVTDAPFLSTASSNSSAAATLMKASTDFAAAVALESAKEGALLQEHTSAWDALWSNGGVEITPSEGQTSDSAAVILGQQINASLYDLLSSTRHDVPYPIGPGGLMTDGYDANAFWDNDVWALPALLPSWPELAQAGLNYRYNVRGAAAAHALEHDYAGLWYPWQTAGTGHECDLAQFANKLEIHVGGGIALLLDKMLLFGGNSSISHDGDKVPSADASAELAAGIADFYASFASPSTSTPGKLSIEHVVPPDEFATGFPLYEGVTDSVYVNVIAARAARLAMRVAAASANSSQLTAWSNLAENITIIEAPAPSGGIYHPEYLHFPDANIYAHKKVKQADVTMLGYPLEFEGVAGGTLTQQNDLEYYEGMYSPKGPAMTSSIDMINWLELGQLDRASHLLANATNHMHAPFHVWTESTDPNQHQSLTDEGCDHFLTGAGGFVQSIINGYGGLRVRSSMNSSFPNGNGGPVLTFNLSLPPSAGSLKLRSISFHGFRLAANIDITKQSRICLIATPSSASKLSVSWASGAPLAILGTVGDCAVGTGRAQVAIS